jgi:hypothetical protein
MMFLTSQGRQAEGLNHLTPRALKGRSKPFFAPLPPRVLALKRSKLRNEPNFIQNMLLINN